MNFWLMKSEPDVFSISDLEIKKFSSWDGVRNYQARNYMRDQMKINDPIFFYHSSCETPGIAGLAKVSKISHPDPTQFDKNSKYYDEKSDLNNPRWFMVEVEFVSKFEKIISLNELRKIEELKEMILLQKGSRLSITPVKEIEFQLILKMFIS